MKSFFLKYLTQIVFGGIIILWFLAWTYINHKHLSPSDAGQFGDKFGFINSLFSGLAFGGIIISIILQKDELALQRLELKATREEFKQQNFESTFFNLLKNQQEVSKRIKTKYYGLTAPLNIGERDVSGLDFFYFSKRQLNLIFLAFEKPIYEKYDQEETEMYLRFVDVEEQRADDDDGTYLNDLQKAFAINNYGMTVEKHSEYQSSNELERIKLIYNYFFKKYHNHIGNYFRHFYHILKFIDESETKELDELDLVKDALEINEIKYKYFRYAQFLQAQMTTDELMLLFYNCSLYSKTLALTAKFKIFDNLSVDDLVDKKHNCILPISLTTKA